MDFISILGNTGLLAYLRCKFSVLPSSIEFHFLNSPYRLSTDERRRITSEVEKYPELIQDTSGLEEADFPPSFPYFFPDLSLHSNGFQCQDCSFIGKERRSIVKHYREEHGWENPRKRGERLKKNEKEDVPWKSGIYYQRFFTQGQKSGFFEVNPRRIFGTGARPEGASSEEDYGDEEVRDVSRSRSYSIRSQGIFLSYSNIK